MDPRQKHPIIAWFADNPVVANILMIAILGWGAFTAINVRKEAFPSFDAESVTVTVPFLGGTPEDVERGVAVKIEEALQQVKGIDRITSVSTESSAVVTVEALEDYPLKKLLDDVKIQVDAIPSFPEQAEKPVVEENQRLNTVMRIDVHGSVGEAVLKEAARNLRDELLKLDGISIINTSGVRDYEISVEVSEEKLRFYNLTFDEVADAISNNSLDLSGGTVRSDGGDISVRSRTQAYLAEDFAEIPLRTTAEGTRIFLRDVASIRDGFVDQKTLAQFDGEPSVGLELQTQGDGDIIKSAELVQAFIKTYPQKFSVPDGVKFTAWNDGAEPIRSRLSLLTSNGITGMALVLIVLALFLNLRLAVWVALGIPISIAGALTLFPVEFIDISLNQLTAFAFIIVLGIIVDDAIVIAEAVYSEKEENPDEDEISTTVRGVSKVVVPAAFGVLTTIAAFYPLTGVSGRMGNVFGQIATAVIFCLIFSLIESKIILPSHLAHIKAGGKPTNFISRFWSKVQGGVSGALDLFVSKVYQPVMRRLVPLRYVVLGLFIAVLILVGGLLPSGKLRFVQFPDIYRDSISANLELEQGLPVEYLHENAERLADALREAVSELEEETGDKILRHISVNASSNTKASIAALLTVSESRRASTADVVKLWRQKMAPVAGAKALTFGGTAGPPGQGLEIQLSSNSLETLKIAADELKDKVVTFPGVNDVQNTFDSGRPEIQIELTPDGEASGFTKRELAVNVRNAFFGREAQRVQRGRDEVKVMVRYPYADRTKIDTLRDMRIRSGDGTAIPFSIVADTQFGDSLASIERADNERIVSVKADIDKSITSGAEVLSQLQAEYFHQLREEHPGLSIGLYGNAEERRKSNQSLVQGFILSAVLIYVLLAIPLRSYVRPLIIMSVIPFGIIGALLGHYIVGIPVSILSVFGILALSGIVVNDSLVLTFRISELQESNPDLAYAECLVRAGKERFRAILLTTLTTFVGLVPLLFEPSVQAQFLKPMAVSVGFGVVFATVITLVLLPMLLMILRDFRKLLGGSLQAWKGLF
ncbi:efflux RND transporter permease subunit [Roseibacillus persicicus]|uniref:efflux RND transporter permease subunit n=1 Tax=Roseibacillus persicicus TaxID=454148 RepID=UPI00398A59A3